MAFGSTLYKADTWLKRTKNLGPVGVRFRQVSLYCKIVIYYYDMIVTLLNFALLMHLSLN